MRAVMGGAAHAWAGGETFGAAFGAAFAALEYAGEVRLQFAALRAWAHRANSVAVVMIEPYMPAYDPQSFGGVTLSRGTLLWALDELAVIDGLDEAASLKAGIIDEAIPLNTVRVRRAPFGKGTAFVLETATGGALVMSLPPGAQPGADPLAVDWT